MNNSLSLSRRAMLYDLKRGDSGLKSGVCWSQGALKALLERGRRFALG